MLRRDISKYYSVATMTELLKVQPQLGRLTTEEIVNH